ncbi:hypothetical protein RS030_111873 [Cryptosporidium xiaoi]|uniref:Bromo domain-containing protein n=1 Tax=Cryptosporidium xiaoi TaxID=659607 RepID=A0AAV9Y1K5_9CRYT
MKTDLCLSVDKNGSTGVRGELILSLDELKKVQQYFIDNSYNYGFELSPEPISYSNNRKNLKKRPQKIIGRTSAGGNEVRNDGEIRKSRNSRPSYSRELKALLEDGMNILESRSETKQSNTQSTVGSRRITEDPLKKMPDWAKRFHRILKMLSQQETFKPYATDININNFSLYLKGQSLENDIDMEGNGANGSEFDYNKKIDELFINANIYFKYLNDCSPIKPISFNKIIKKLENNEYLNAANVFNDIYSVWICAFRAIEPGGILWTKTIDACLNFNLKLLNEPLKDDFSLTFPGTTKNSGINKGSKNIDDVNKDGPPFKKMNEKNNVFYNERYKKESYLPNYGTGASSVGNDHFSNNKNKRTNQQGNSKSNNKGGKKNSNNYESSNSLNNTISEVERREFQLLLGKLSQNDHVELFNSFLSTAHWKEVDTGEVELDDQQTPPNIFREMIKWCKIKLNVPISDDSTSKNISKIATKKTKQPKVAPNALLNKKKSQLSAKQFFSSGRAFSSSDSEDDDDNISSCGNLQISQQWESTSSSGESENEPELTSFFPHFNSK